MDHRYRIYLAVIGLLAFFGFLLFAGWLAYIGQPVSALWATGGGIVSVAIGLFNLLKSLGKS